MKKFFKKLFKIKTTRYFIVYYTLDTERSYSNGLAHISTSGENAFFSFNDFIEGLRIKCPSFNNITITGFNELSKDDYYQSMTKKTN
jgi:hypothetical protein